MLLKCLLCSKYVTNKLIWLTKVVYECFIRHNIVDHVAIEWTHGPLNHLPPLLPSSRVCIVRIIFFKKENVLSIV